MPSRKTELKPVIAYPREAVVDAAQLGAALGVSACPICDRITPPLSAEPSDLSAHLAQRSVADAMPVDRPEMVEEMGETRAEFPANSRAQPGKNEASYE